MGLLGVILGTTAIKMLPAAAVIGRGMHTQQKIKRRVRSLLHPHRKDVIIMKKSTLAIMIVVLAAIAGALTTCYFYLRRREAELDEYEQLLFSEDFSNEIVPEMDEEAVMA